MVEFQKIYDRLGATIIERGESFYNKMMPDVVKELDEKSMYRLILFQPQRNPCIVYYLQAVLFASILILQRNWFKFLPNTSAIGL